MSNEKKIPPYISFPFPSGRFQRNSFCLRISLALSWSCLIAAEMLPGSVSGVGYLIIHAYNMARIDVVISGMICIGATGALMDWLFHQWEERCFAWARRVR